MSHAYRTLLPGQAQSFRKAAALSITLAGLGSSGAYGAPPVTDSTRGGLPPPNTARLVPKVVTTRPAQGAPQVKKTVPLPAWLGRFTAANGAASGFGTVGPYGQARWAEDWSFLAHEPADVRRRDWFNRLKYVRLNDSGSIWVSFSGEERLRYVFENQPALGKAGVTDASRVLLRNQYGADLHLGSHVRIYAELLDAVAGGSNTYGYQTGLQRERLDMQQGFVELRGKFLGAHMGVMGGRQLFLDAPVMMQSARDIPNVQQTWDGFRGYALWKNFRIDIFDFFQTNKQPVGIFSNGTNYSGRLYGAYASGALPAFRFMGQRSQLYLDAFFIGYLYGSPLASVPTATVGGATAGTTRRDGIGGRLWGKVGPFTVNLDGIYQGGSFHPVNNGAHRRVDAYAVNGGINYTIPKVTGAPTFGVQADLFSGGNYNQTSGSVGTFGTPYFPLPYYNDVTMTLNNQNLIGVGPVMTFAAAKKVSLRLHAPFFWRDSTQDALYGIGRVYTPRDGLHGGYVGAIPQFQVSWSFAPHWVWTHDIAGILASRGVREAGLNSGAYYMQTMQFVF
ncbi:alginate export family protein [Komagataeibacter oboediens]|uniref:alginate export family protein n=1 Tax=Komagataeibacter oboediens TaxID=65958 RepID=UPI001C2D5B75|nr:alginate export family protein [Komagataeibacter oboediens]MBV1825140.1 alginate export family protein [Komagataeibacter oboediens]